MVKIFIYIVTIIGAGLLLTAPSNAAPENTRSETILLISSEDGALYQNFIRAFRQTLDKLDSRHLYKISVRLSGEPAEVQNKTALIITIGSKATASYLQNNTLTDSAPPVLAVLIPKPAFTILSNNAQAQNALANGQLSAVYLDQPFQRQINLIRLLVPNTTAIGSVLGPGSKNQQAELASITRKNNLALNTALLIPGKSGPLPALQNLIPPQGGSDVILALPDRTVYNRFTIRPLLLATFRQNVPVFAYSQALVGAGAVAGVYSVPGQLGQQAAELTYSYLQPAPANRKLPTPVYPSYFQVSINRQISELLGLDPPAAAALELRLKAMEAPQND